MSQKRDLGWLWHGLLGAVASGSIVGLMVLAHGPAWIPFLMVPLLAFGGWVRERSQHVGPPKMHEWVEACAWPAGGLIAAGLGLLWL